ncbi:uncharacterized protein LOC122624524 isoform X2 [Drosophila teissieri]|nr:uncharacterized protein LOC122624524 isoform X2 [Drosophila teissieri]
MRSDQEIHTIDPHVSPNSTQRPKYKQYATRESWIFLWPPKSESLPCKRVRNRMGRTRRSARKICFAKKENGKSDLILFISDTQRKMCPVCDSEFPIDKPFERCPKEERYMYPNRKSVRPSDANGRSKCRKRDDDQIEKNSNREGGPDLFVLEWGSSDPPFYRCVMSGQVS